MICAHYSVEKYAHVIIIAPGSYTPLLDFYVSLLRWGDISITAAKNIPPSLLPSHMGTFHFFCHCILYIRSSIHIFNAKYKV